ncbi:MAG: OmpH family outer membrane protein [Leeuwenhoekiella sp.]
MKKLFIVALIAMATASCEKEKTAYVNTEKILEEYQEMVDARDEYQTQSTQMQMSMQQQVQTYQEEVQAYQEGMARMSASEREVTEQDLMSQRQQLQQMQQMSGMQLQQQSQARMDSVMKKIKDYVKKYGESNGYDYIYSQTEAGGVLYAKEGYEITEEVLKSLNDSYGSNSKTEDQDETDEAVEDTLATE